MPENDTFRTIGGKSAEILFKEKNSKFFASAFNVDSQDDIANCLATMRKRHPSAGHHCYAWQLGAENPSHRANDDGEPSNTAGMPIYGQIQSFGLTNVLVVVVRYFGGVKLGVGGLISAYRSAAQLALEQATVIEKTIDRKFTVSFTYKDLNKVMRIIKEHDASILDQSMELTCVVRISIRRSRAEKFALAFAAHFEIVLSEA